MRARFSQSAPVPSVATQNHCHPEVENRNATGSAIRQHIIELSSAAPTLGKQLARAGIVLGLEFQEKQRLPHPGADLTFRWRWAFCWNGPAAGRCPGWRAGSPGVPLGPPASSPARCRNSSWLWHGDDRRLRDRAQRLARSLPMTGLCCSAKIAARAICSPSGCTHRPGRQALLPMAPAAKAVPLAADDTMPGRLVPVSPHRHPRSGWLGFPVTVIRK